MICVNSVSVYPKSISLKVGTWSYAAYAEVCPSNADCKEVQWHSDNPSVASVNASSGYICANGVGTAHIYSTATDGSGCSDYLTVTVSNTVPVTSVTLNRSSLSLEEGHSASLSATVCPDNATNKNVNWTSSNNSVATVNSGVVTAIAKGSARITATAADGSGKSASCTVSVTGDILATSIELTPSDKTLRVGYSFFPSVTVCPTNATKKSVTWSSANSNIASVNPNSGLVYAKAVGTTTIYATACDGSGVCGYCTVSVVPVYVQDIVVCPEALTLDVGARSCLEATVYPVNATNPNVSWTSGDCNIADVDSTGCVTAKSAGTTYICANAQDGSGVHGCCEVTINAPVVENTVPGLRTIKQCRVRKDMSMEDSAILKDSSGANVKLNIGETVPLLSTTTISANGRVWYRILYNGMMLHVTADDQSFEEIDVAAPSIPEGRDIFANPGLESNINIRSTPFETDGNIIGQFAHGTNLTLTCNTPQNSEWFAIYGETTTGNYTYGWCSGRYLAYYFLNTIRDCYVRTSMVISPSTILKDSSGKSVVLREDTVDTVRLWKLNTLTGDDYSDYNGKIRNDWYMVEYNGQIAYVTADSFYVFGFGEPMIDENQNGDVSLLTPISSNNYLSQSQIENNAMIVYDYLSKQGWSKNAICGAIANMQAESTINPGLWEKGNTTNPGYGLVQWTPATKWTDYADSHGYNHSDLNRQLEYLIYSMQPGRGEWLVGGVAPTYQLYASEYISSTRSAYDLAIVFLLCYERPLDQSDSVKSYRGSLANNWLSFFNSLGW